VQRGLDLGRQLRLVVLDDQQVIRAAGADGLGHIAVGEHGVAGHHLARKGQHTQEFQGGLVFVGLGVDAHLRQNGRGGRHIGTQQVDAGDVALLGGAGGLAVQGDGVPAVLVDA
jgi:hypothetical protein